MLYTIFIIATIISGVVIAALLILNITAPVSKSQVDKAIPIECGFEDHLKGSRSPFSIYFFALAVLFLVFDVETVILFPSPLILNFFPDLTLLARVFRFLLILLLGLIHETRQGALKWA